MDTETREALDKMTWDEARELIRDIVYSEEHLSKSIFRIILLVDPDAAPDAYEFFKTWIKLRKGY